jgi:hypothetical protein
MGKARVATGRVPILSASVKKPDKESGKTISRSLVDMLLQIDPQLYTPFVTEENGMPVVYMEIWTALYGMIKSPLLIYRKLRKDFEQNEFTVNPYDIRVANKTISRSQSEAMQTLGKGADNYIVCHKVETQKDMGETRKAKPNDQGCPIDDRLYDVPCKLAQGIKDERQRVELWNLPGSIALTSWETGVCWRYVPYDSRPNKSDFRNEKDHGYIVGYTLSRLDKLRKECIRVRKGYGYFRS